MLNKKPIIRTNNWRPDDVLVAGNPAVAKRRLTEDAPAPRRIGVSKGKWYFPEDWEAQDKTLDAEIAKDFYAVSL